MLGWIVSIVVAFVGGFVAAEFGNVVFESALMALARGNLGGGSLAASGSFLLYVGLAAMMLLMLFGSWLALQVVNRWR